MKITTLCYIEHDGQYLMLHRIKKENDINEGKWIGVGGHAENGESPEECLLRIAYFTPRSQRGNRAHTYIIPFPRAHNFYK